MVESSDNFINFLLTRRSMKAIDLCEPGPSKKQVDKMLGFKGIFNCRKER